MTFQSGRKGDTSGRRTVRRREAGPGRGSRGKGQVWGARRTCKSKRGGLQAPGVGAWGRLEGRLGPAGGWNAELRNVGFIPQAKVVLEDLVLRGMT